MSRSREITARSALADRTGAERVAFIARLQLILSHWRSADRLARATGVSPSAFRKWLRGEAEPSRERLVALAQAAGVGVGWLVSGEGPEPRLGDSGHAPDGSGMSPRAGFQANDFVVLPKRPDAVAAGSEAPQPPPAAAEFIALRHDWVRDTLGIEPNHLLVETAFGESMLPGIRSGDLLLVDATDHRLHSFGIYVLEVAGKRLVKRVHPKLDGSLMLISDNTAYEADHIPRERTNDIGVVGRVVWTCGPTRGAR